MQTFIEPMTNVFSNEMLFSMLTDQRQRKKTQQKHTACDRIFHGSSEEQSLVSCALFLSINFIQSEHITIDAMKIFILRPKTTLRSQFYIYFHSTQCGSLNSLNWKFCCHLSAQRDECYEYERNEMKLWVFTLLFLLRFICWCVLKDGSTATFCGSEP